MILVGGAVLLPDSLFHNATAAMLWTIQAAIEPGECIRAALSGSFQTLLHQLITARIRVNNLDIDTSEVEKGV